MLHCAVSGVAYLQTVYLLQDDLRCQSKALVTFRLGDSGDERFFFFFFPYYLQNQNEVIQSLGKPPGIKHHPDNQKNCTVQILLIKAVQTYPEGTTHVL